MEKIEVAEQVTKTFEVAEQVTKTFEVGTWLRSMLGFSITLAQFNELITLIVGLMTVAYTFMKMVEWFETRRDRRRANRNQTRFSHWLDLQEEQQDHHQGKD